MTDERSESLVGRVLLDKLEVLRLLGEGGMGAVYEVEHRLTRHHRALKVLHPALATSAEAVARFLREAPVAGTLGSPHVVETYDAGVLDSGAPYVLMELLEGETLGQRLGRDGCVDARTAAAVVAEAARGAAVAHEAGIVHRDLKPDNLFLLREPRPGGPRVKVLDFGISKFLSGATSMALTGERITMGTPYYMAPEQIADSSAVDGRADVYALGVVLYEAASGRRPFIATTLPALFAKIHEGAATPLGEAVPGMDARLVEIVEKAMHRDPARRYESARELSNALEAFVAGDAAVGEVARRRSRRIGVWALRAAVVLGVAIGVRLVTGAALGSEDAGSRSGEPRTVDTLASTGTPFDRAYAAYIEADNLGCLEAIGGVEPSPALATLAAACELGAGRADVARRAVASLVEAGRLSDDTLERTTPEFVALVRQLRPEREMAPATVEAPEVATPSTERTPERESAPESGEASEVARPASEPASEARERRRERERRDLRPSEAAMLDLDPYGDE